MKFTFNIMRNKLLVFALTFMLVGIGLTISLRGTLPNTSLVLEPEFNVLVVPYGVPSDNILNVNFVEDELSRCKYGGTSPLEIAIDSGCLLVKANFTRINFLESVWVSWELNVDVSKYPLLNMKVHVSEGVLYHIRFEGFDSNGEFYQVWLEESPIDDRKGKGIWEDITINLKDFVYIATGREDLNITTIKIIMEDYPFDIINPTLAIAELSFQAPPPLNTIGSLDENASVIVLSVQKPELVSNYTLIQIRVCYTTSGLGNYTVYGVLWDKNSPIVAKIYMYRLEEKSHYEVTRVYPTHFRLHGYLTELADVTLTAVGDINVIFSSSGGYFDLFDVNKVLLIYESAPYTYPALTWVEPNMTKMATTYYVILTSIVPIIIIAYIYVKHYGKNSNHRNLLVLIIVGIFLRLLVAPFTSHPFDIEFWKSAAREYYGAGTIHLQLWPTMPLYFYLLLFSYSFYALLGIAGFQDFRFLAHPTNVVESIFIKMPFILADVASFYFLIKILSRGKKTEGRHLFYASLYFFNPLVIYISSAFGTYDTLALSFLLGGLYLFFVKQKNQSAIILCILSGLTKLIGFAIYALLVIHVLIRREYKQVTKALAVGICITLLAFTPFIVFGGIEEFNVSFTQRILGASRQVREGPTNPFPLYPWIYLTLITLVVLWYMHIVRSKEKVTLLDISTTMALILLIHYLTFRAVGNHQLSWIIPFLIIIAYLKNNEGMVPYILIFSLAPIIRYSSEVTLGYLAIGKRYDIVPLLNWTAATVGLVLLLLLGFYYIFSKPKTGMRAMVLELVKITTMYIILYLIVSILVWGGIVAW